MDWHYTDGGRKEAGFLGKTGDCAARALAISESMPYLVQMGEAYVEAYKLVAQANKDAGGKKSARDGIMKDAFHKLLVELGYQWHSAPKYEGRKARPRDFKHDGVIIARQARHFVAVVNGDVFDTWDSTDKMVYGYWKK